MSALFKEKFLSKSPLLQAKNEIDPDKPGLFDKIKDMAIDGAKNLIPGYTIASTVGKAGLNFAKGQLAKNLNPYEYENTVYSDGGRESRKQGPGERVLRALVSKEDQMGSWKGQATKERKDLLGMMLGRQQEYNSIPVSEYRPSSSKDQEAVYYRSPTSEETIKEKLKDPEFLKSFKPNSKGTMSLMDYFSDTKSGSGDNVLGKYTLNQGEDDKGKYVSYYDKWDLEPYKGSNKTLNNISNKAQELAGIKPTELYGRVYY
tara:strand:- start:247 stop:1026 length:780 start_codon:yes stop_codon:yes gene_type:complete